MNTPPVPAWADTSCLLCGAPPTVGHRDDCPGADPDAVGYLTERLPGAITRSWTMAGVQYTATPARRAAVTALMPQMQWHQAGRKVSLPFSIGLLIKELMPKLGVQRWLAAFGYHPLATISVPDCSCTDPLRCRYDFPGHPHANAAPDLWADYALLVLRLRRPQGWLDLWLLDIGIGAVVIAEDDIAGDPIPTDASIACQMGWCDLCDGTRPARHVNTHVIGQAQVTPPCTHRCHPAITTAGGGQPEAEAGDEH